MINELAETPWDDEEESPMPVVISDVTAQPLRDLGRVEAHRRAPNLAGIVVMVAIPSRFRKNCGKNLCGRHFACMGFSPGRSSFSRQSVESNVRIPMFQVIESTLLSPVASSWPDHFLHFVSIDQGSVSAASRPSLRLERLQISLREGISLLGEGHALPICALGLDLGLLGKEDITSRVRWSH